MTTIRVPANPTVDVGPDRNWELYFLQQQESSAGTIIEVDFTSIGFCDPFRRPVLEDDEGGGGGDDEDDSNVSSTFLTSPPYPVNFSESYICRPSIRSIRSWEALTESYSVDAEVVSINLRPILISYEDWPPETYSVDGEVTSIELRTILKSYEDWPPEAYSTDAEVTSIELLSLLVSTTTDPETYTTSAEITSLELV